LEVERLPAPQERALVPGGARPARRAWARWLVVPPLLLGAVWGALFLANRVLPGRGGGAESKLLQARTWSDDGTRFLQQGSLDSAEARFGAALVLDQGLGPAKLGLAQVLRLRGQATRAATLLAEVLRDHPDDRALRTAAYSGLADIAMDDGTWPQAVEHLRRGFALDSSERAYSQLGYALVRAARPAEAVTLLRRGLGAYAGSAALHKNAAFALMQLDSLRAARAEADRALALDPRFAPALGLRARIRVRAGDVAGALADHRAFLAAAPDSAEAAQVEAELRAAGALK
jgi:tetratricopeptide (TPR) repeat protein